MKAILGTGPLGIAVMKVLLESNPNEQITLVNRSGRIGVLPRNVSIVAADVTDKNMMEDIASRSEVIFSCTDVPHKERENSATVFALANAMRQTAAKLIFADNIYSYRNMAQRTQTALTGPIIERQPHKAQTRERLIRASPINALLKSGSGFHDRVAVVRAADVIGPGIRNGIFGVEFLDKLYKCKTVVFLENINAPHSFTFLNDFARALVNVGTAADTFGEIWHVPNAPAMSIDKWIHLFEVNANRKVKLIVLPKVVIWLAGLFNSLITESHELAYHVESYHADSLKYTTRFGKYVTYPSSIVKQTVQWYKREHQQYENQ